MLMWTHLDHLFDDEEAEDENRSKVYLLRAKRKFIRDHSNPLDLDNKMFKRYFRLTKECVTLILDDLKDSLPISRSFASVPEILKICACLRFFAEGSYQKGVGNDFNLGLGQSTFSEIFCTYLNIMEAVLCSKWITFQTTAEEERNCKNHFYTKFGFPGVIGCVDGSHIKMISPKKDIRHLYYCRKGYYSINSMIVNDHRMRIMYVDARNPGANHDSFIWNHNELNDVLSSEYENGRQNSWLLGDAGYPLKPYLMTPFKNVQAGSTQLVYNQIHSKARNINERTIGVLKSRFRCILGARELHYKPKKVTQIINVVCALHNICRFYNIQLEDDELLDLTEDDVQNEVDANRDNLNLQAGIAIRNRIMVNMN